MPRPSFTGLVSPCRGTPSLPTQTLPTYLQFDLPTPPLLKRLHHQLHRLMMNHLSLHNCIHHCLHQAYGKNLSESAIHFKISRNFGGLHLDFITIGRCGCTRKRVAACFLTTSLRYLDAWPELLVKRYLLKQVSSTIIRLVLRCVVTLTTPSTA